MDIEKNFEEELKKIEEKIKDAEENLGDVELRDCLMEKAVLHEKFGKIEQAIEIYKQAQKKTIGVGKKMDVEFVILLIYVKQKNLQKIQESIEFCKKLFEEGGDWERKNRLKVKNQFNYKKKKKKRIYEGIYNLLIRDLKKTSQLFLECISTFNSSEIISYKQLVFYTVLTSLVSLGRSEIKKNVNFINQLLYININIKVVHNSEILTIIRDMPYLKNLLDAFAKCDYKAFFINLTQILTDLRNDEYLSNHVKFYTREIRVVIYSQFLESYKTVTLQSMASSFGVSVDFIDKELSDLISGRRLTCKIDKVQGIIESERVDQRNTLYQQALKQGDNLLNQVQKLSRVIDI
ncbi:proteasome regulatory subunit, putative [Ichthyophthirius multifiliis]|uniref:Proteasome regulatory subunit, putative n=1 Tax=Ichthyophthirius multifiliis TaxID=5932 RepID=G0QV01_ICHMU|nr:proteasome regulatory subunit, putative [Ichthyophthirius multifiliis]EGR30955.1 proteasome regulatory subunit, putative [Ichthyophthirius multifiliis]|eukprot:XP_004032542.1 proteasome regulatory subunit, putative [Ichthyophthirius multifiliis]